MLSNRPQLPPSQVQFLHWVGFDPSSSLPPPNNDTTEALAFLAYDFMGKIVEKVKAIKFSSIYQICNHLINALILTLTFCAKSLILMLFQAIFLRWLKQNKRKENSKNWQMILELEGHEQLTKKDIENSLNDSTVTSKPLYNASRSALGDAGFAQLYFGPGFEERVEMEMEQ